MAAGDVGCKGRTTLVRISMSREELTGVGSRESLDVNHELG